MAHSLGGFLDLPHGECNALLLDHVIEFNFEAEVKKYKDISTALGLNIDELDDKAVKKVLINKIRDLKVESDVNKPLKDVGVSMGDIPQLAHKTMNDACIITNPRRPTIKDVEEIFKNPNRS
jgi:alcohol dehydrogenase class IV